MFSKTIKCSIVLLFLLTLAAPTSLISAAGEVPPFAGAPECMDANGDGHADVTDNLNFGMVADRELYHDLWNEMSGCHYNHEHGDDPNAPEIVAIFGRAGDMWNGVTEANIGVPFATSAAENTMKHPMAKYYTMTSSQLDVAGFPCGVGNDTDNGGDGTAHCVRAWRVLAHGEAGLMEALTNNHSFFAEIRVCHKDDLSQCGTIRAGGWFYYGKLVAPFYGVTHFRPGGTIDIGGMTMTFKSDMEDLASIGSPNTVFDNFGGEPYWFMTPKTSQNLYNVSKYGDVAGDQWSTNEIGPSKEFDCAPFPVGAMCGNRLIHLLFRAFDGWNLLDTSNVNNPYFICSQTSTSNCGYNSSLRGINEAQAWINPAWDQAAFDTDTRVGFVSLVGWTDRYQRLQAAGVCSAIAVDCVPLSLESMPVGYSSVKKSPGRINPGFDREHDIYFNGQSSGWINEFNIHEHTPPSNTPPPPTQPSSEPFVSTDINPASLNVGGTALVSVNLNNVPVEGYQSAEFTCSYNSSLIEKSNIVAANLFGVEPVVAVHDPQNGSFIFAIAGTNGNKATTSGPAFTFNVKGIQTGQSPIQCTARVSKGDNLPIDLPSTGADLMIGVDSSPTPFVPPASTPTVPPEPTATAVPAESPTPMPSPNGSLSGQVVASKPVTIQFYDANNVAITSVIANPDGSFNLTLLAGNYTVVAMASGFLSHQGSVVITAGNTTVLPTGNLLAGDIDGNNVIDQFDALTIGMSYTSSAPGEADLNSDGVIDFLDLELLAENYRKTGPSIWE